MPLRCLIVDDSRLFLDGARVLLTREGLDIVGIASTGAEAIRQLDALHPDVVLVDVFLGQESGLDLVRRMVEADAGHAATLILISSHADADMRELVATSVAAGFITKADLSAAAIRRIVDGRPS